MQIRSFAFCKQRIQIIRCKKFNSLHTHLQPETITEVVQVEVVPHFIFFIVTIYFLDLFGMALYPESGIRAYADSE